MLFVDSNYDSRIDQEIDLNHYQPKGRNVCYYLPESEEIPPAK